MFIVLIKLVLPLKQDEDILEYNLIMLVLQIPDIMYAAW